MMGKVFSKTGLWRCAVWPCVLAGMVPAVMAGAQDAARPYPQPVRTYDDLTRETGLTGPGAVALGRMAVDVGGKDWPTTVSFRCNAKGGHVVSGLQAPKATKVFDNLYYVGAADVAAWALTTSQGIILIDALTDRAEAQTYIVDGLRSLGLDPASVRYILVSHEHGDHYGGAPLIQELSGAHVFMGEIAWQAIEHMDAHSPLARSPRPKRDKVLTDGGTVSLGGMTVTAVATPGHTPGTFSFILPVVDHGQTHWAAYWGGNGLPHDLRGQQTFLDALYHFSQATSRVGVDVEISPHGDTDDTIQRLSAMGKGMSNPFLIGRDRYLRYEEVFTLCTRARMAETLSRGAKSALSPSS